MKRLRKNIVAFVSVVAVLWFVMASVAGAVDRQTANIVKAKIENDQIENEFLLQAVKEGQTMLVELASGKALLGRLKRFDQLVVVIEIEGNELLVYKHAIATISPPR